MSAGRDGFPFPRSTLLRREAYEDRETTFHVTISAHPRLTAFSARLAQSIWREVITQPQLGNVHLHAACLIPDHLHLLVQPAVQDLLTFVGRWKSHTTRVAWATGHHGALWQPKMWDRSIRDERDFVTTIRYIIDNPVQAGLVSRWEDWPWTWLPSEEAP